MARDEREYRPTFPRKQFTSTDFVNWVETYSGSPVCYLSASGRDDAESTIPYGNVYFRPTSYFGRYFVGSGNSYNCIYKRAIDWRREEGVATMSEVAGTSVPWRNGATTYGLPVLPTGLLSRVEARLRSQVLNQAWNLGQSLGELPETIASIVDLLKIFKSFVDLLTKRKAEALWDYVRKSRKSGTTATRRRKGIPKPISKRRALRSTAQGVSQGWLAYKFFWLPIMSDIHSLLEALESTMQEPGLFRATASDSEAMKAPTITGDSSNIILSAEFSGAYKCKAMVAYKIANPSSFTLSSYGLTDPIGLAWELLPLSFVVDWFLSVGNFLQALSRPMGLIFSYGYQTSYMRWQARYEWIPKLTGATYIGGSYPIATGFHKSHRRNLYAGFPVPSPYFRGFGDLGADKVITLIALAFR